MNIECESVAMKFKQQCKKHLKGHFNAFRWKGRGCLNNHLKYFYEGSIFSWGVYQKKLRDVHLGI